MHKLGVATLGDLPILPVMKKSLIGILVIVVVGAVALYVFGGMLISKVAVAGVEAFVPQVTGTPVKMEKLSVSPLTGSGTVEGFVLGNPEGYKSEYSISFGSAHMDVAPMSILGDRILIEKIHVYQPKFNYETKLLTSNIKEILNNVKAASGRPVEDAEGVPEKVEDSGIRIEVKELIIDEAQVSLSMAGATVPVPVPKIVLRDIGTDEGGIPPDEMAFEVMSVVLQQVLQAAASSPGSAVDGIKKLFGGG